MNKTRTLSVFLRVAAVWIGLAGLSGRTTDAQPPFQGAPVIVVPNLVAYWSMDSASGSTVADLSPSGNNGMLSGAALIDTGNKATVPTGNPASLGLAAGNGDMMTVSDSSSLSLTGALTIAAWIRPTLAAGGTQHGIIEKFDGGGTNGYNLRLSSNNDLGFTIYGPSGGKGISTAGRPPTATNVWSHVAGVYNPTPGAGNPQMVQYRDAVQDALASNTPGYVIEPVPAPADGVSELHVGADYGTNRFGGNIDEVRIYNRALNSTEIQILHDGQPAATGLVASGVAGAINLSWTAPAGSLTTPTYSILRGTSSGTYTTVVNGVSGTTYSDTSVTAGTPYFYVVVAVTVMASANSNESSATSGAGAPPPPPPPPPAPRTSKSGNENDPCGCGTAGPIGLSGGVVGAMLLAALLLASSRRPT